MSYKLSDLSLRIKNINTFYLKGSWYCTC